MCAAAFRRMQPGEEQGEDRPQPDPGRESREPRPMQKDAPTEGGGVAQGDIRVPRHPDTLEEEQP